MHASEVEEIATLTEETCFHCHEICPEDVIEYDEKAFCCHGCKQVYQLLNDNSLADYYVCDVNPGKAPSAQNFEFLNNPHFQDKLISFSSQGVSKVNFHLPAIHCRSCLYLLENLQKLNSGIVKTTLNFGKKDLTVWFHEDQINLGQLASLLASLGYEPLISSDEVSAEKRKHANHQTQLFIKLGIAGFCAGNAMLFSFPEYLGIEDGSLKQLFGYLNITLGSLTVFYSGSDYFKNVWAHLKLGKMTIELPILIGILVGYGRSIYEVFSQTGAGYMDSVSGLIFFLLIGKWFQQKSFDFLSFERNYKSYFPLVISKWEGGKEVNYPLNEIKIGDRLIIRNQEIIPADAVLISGSSQLDYSFVTGESEMVEINAGSSMYAGGRHTGERIEIEIKKELKQSHLTQLWEQQAFKDPLHKTENWENFANQVGKYFTIGLISLAIIVGSYWLYTDINRWPNAVVSILVIACPCALAISYPFALGHGIRWLAKSNFFIKDIQAFERMAQVDTIVLDKTGTLTLPSTLEPIAKLTRKLSSSEWSALYSLALQSTHPMSRQFVRYVPKKQLIAPVEKFAEKTGKGLEAIIKGVEYRLGNAKFTGHKVPKDNDYIRSESQLYIQIGGISVGFIEFPWIYRAGIEVMIHQLQAKYRVYLLSGDKQAHAGSILDWFPDPSTYQFECSPMDKMRFIQSLQEQGHHVAMIGDGLNDAGALRQAHVGIAISDDHLHFTPASDAILKGKQLAQLPKYLAFSRFGLKLIKLSFLLSLVYNAIGLSYAVQGNLSPLIAAVLMPVNSISMLLIANLGMSWKGHALKS